METHVFDVHGPFALFRKPYAPVSPVSFPFPPPPTVIGMIGAICGYDKETYLEEVGWDRVRIGVGIRAETRRLRTGINLINTKVKPFYEASGEAARIQIPHEFLVGLGGKDVRFRLYVANGTLGMMEDLSTHLRAGTTTYTLSLGLSECLAKFEHVGTFEGEALEPGSHQLATVIPDDQVESVHYDPEGKYGHYRVPHRMAPGRQVESYSVAIAEETAQPIEAETSNAYQVGEDRVVFL